MPMVIGCKIGADYGFKREEAQQNVDNLLAFLHPQWKLITMMQAACRLQENEVHVNQIIRLNSVFALKVFCCIPTDDVRTLHELHEYQQRPVMARVDPDEARRQLRKVKGYLVLLPLQFLVSENLTPAAGTKEALAPTVIWT
jgi:hypothetical protein